MPAGWRSLQNWWENRRKIGEVGPPTDFSQGLAKSLWEVRPRTLLMLYLGADHRGFKLKEKIKEYLQEKGISFEDLGAFEYEPKDDYPDFVHLVAKKMAEAPETNRGILLCGTGQGVNIAANKVKNIYSFLGWSVKAIKAHEQVNVLSLPADFLSEKEAVEIVRIFLEARFPLKGREERDKRRMAKIKKIEQENA